MGGLSLMKISLVRVLSSGVDKSPADVTVFDDTVFIWNFGCFGVTDGGNQATVGRAHHDISLGRAFAVKVTPPHITAGIINRDLVKIAVGSCHINVFKKAFFFCRR